ncbi:MAG: hypothetical protein EHM61_09605 [Acidobacteria bacterium]|nr:MAG: hypothetical protein EHM61_09605 [Acidobacteriota bacterium]
MYDLKSKIVEMGQRGGSWLATAVICCLLFAAAVPSAQAQSKGKPSPNPKVSVEILPYWNVEGDQPAMETIDGQEQFLGWQPYKDGVDGVEAQIWAGGSEDMTLRLYDSPRRFRAGYSCWNPTGGTPSCQGAPDPNTGWFINIRQIGNMAEGETLLTDAHIAVEPAKSSLTSFNWCGSGTCQGSGFLVSVQKDATGWTVSSVDPTSFFGGSVVPIAGLTRRTSRTTQFLGLYQLTFQLRIELLQQP